MLESTLIHNLKHSDIIFDDECFKSPIMLKKSEK